MPLLPTVNGSDRRALAGDDEEPQASARAAVRRLAASMSSVAPLVNALDAPVRVAVSGPGAPAGAGLTLGELGDEIQALLDRLADGATARRIVLHRDAAPLSAFELIVSDRLALASMLELPPDVLRALRMVVDDVALGTRAHGVEAALEHRELQSWDGSRLRVYADGSSDRKAVVLVQACGMPIGLCEPWMRRLAQEFRVITWESRGLFGAMGTADEFDARAHDVSAQARDMLAVMDHFGVERAHATALCGGAVIALAAAATAPERISSLSLWHGDYELGEDAPKTQHQRDVQTLMTMAGRGRAKAAGLQKMFKRPSVLAKIRADMAHHVMYPYASGELLYRYGRLNGAIMDHDCRSLLDRVDQPALVATSHDDHTAHPDGSRYVAGKLRRAELYMGEHGDHLSLFEAESRLGDLAAAFIAREAN
ncbi:alpha/beta hydrolase [Sorangium sp. So ce834]|uniref:alpha/beta fold hydrolase n=1 Tax=Sorangium sp. So ce834 TaxID=3133321 RepID=UPI003F632066